MNITVKPSVYEFKKGKTFVLPRGNHFKSCHLFICGNLSVCWLNAKSILPFQVMQFAYFCLKEQKNFLFLSIIIFFLFYICTSQNDYIKRGKQNKFFVTKLIWVWESACHFFFDLFTLRPQTNFLFFLEQKNFFFWNLWVLLWCWRLLRGLLWSWFVKESRWFSFENFFFFCLKMKRFDWICQERRLFCANFAFEIVG